MNWINQSAEAKNLTLMCGGKPQSEATIINTIVRFPADRRTHKRKYSARLKARVSRHVLVTNEDKLVFCKILF